MKRNLKAPDSRKIYRPSVPNRLENRPTFDRFPEEILFPNLFRLK